LTRGLAVPKDEAALVDLVAGFSQTRAAVLAVRASSKLAEARDRPEPDAVMKRADLGPRHHQITPR
jgi:hypothetical protein